MDGAAAAADGGGNGGGGDENNNDNNPSPFHPSPASLEFNGFVVIRGALSCALAEECRDFVNDTLADSLLREGEADKELFGAIAPPRVNAGGGGGGNGDSNGIASSSSGFGGYGAPVLHRWNVLVNGIDGTSSTPGNTSNVVGRVLGEVLSASCGQDYAAGGTAAAGSLSDGHNHLPNAASSVGGFLELVCGRDAELCDLSGLVSDPGSEEQLLHYDTRYSSAAPSRGRATPVNESSSPHQKGAQNNDNDEAKTHEDDEGRSSTESLRCSRSLVYSDESKFEVVLTDEPGASAVGETAEKSELLMGARQQQPQNKSKRLVTAFVALQDVTETMGPTLIVPRTANKAAHTEIYDAVNPAALTAALEEYQSRGVECVLRTGDVVLMDSRALHLGGANTSDTRRILLDFAFVDPAVVPGTYCGCISQEIGDRRLKLSDYKAWTAN